MTGNTSIIIVMTGGFFPRSIRFPEMYNMLMEKIWIQVLPVLRSPRITPASINKIREEMNITVKENATIISAMIIAKPASRSIKINLTCIFIFLFLNSDKDEQYICIEWEFLNGKRISKYFNHLFYEAWNLTGNMI